MKTLTHDNVIWSNEKEFLKIESNGKPSCKLVSFVLENNKARFTRVSEIQKTELEKFLDNENFKPTSKVLTLA